MRDCSWVRKVRWGGSCEFLRQFSLSEFSFVAGEKRNSFSVGDGKGGGEEGGSRWIEGTMIGEGGMVAELREDKMVDLGVLKLRYRAHCCSLISI